SPSHWERSGGASTRGFWSAVLPGRARTPVHRRLPGDPRQKQRRHEARQEGPRYSPPPSIPDPAVHARHEGYTLFGRLDRHERPPRSWGWGGRSDSQKAQRPAGRTHEETPERRDGPASERPRSRGLRSLPVGRHTILAG